MKIMTAPHTITATFAKPAHIGDPSFLLALRHCIGQTAATAVMAAAVAATFAIVP
jgi:hypothetical protein